MIAGQESTQVNVLGEYTSSPWPVAELSSKVVPEITSLHGQERVNVKSWLIYGGGPHMRWREEQNRFGLSLLTQCLPD